MDDFGIRFVGAIFTGICIAFFVKAIVKPTSGLSGRVRPYTAASRSALGRSADQSVVSGREQSVSPHGVLARIYRPIAEAITEATGKVFGSAFNDETLMLKLKQADLMSDVNEHERAHEFRIRQVGAALGWGCGGALLAAIVGAPAALIILVFIVAATMGGARRSADVSKRIEARQERMRVELYTINQLLAIYLRTSGSPVLAAQRLVRRGRGAVIEELDEALRLHARGMSSSKAFDRIADQTPEPFAARTYKLLASGSERGADLANALLSLSEDVRDHRRTGVRRSATKRQAAMLLPIIAFLAPVMLLFIAGPLPSLVFSSFR